LIIKINTSPFTIDEAENLTKKALEKEMSIEGVVLLRVFMQKRKTNLNLISGTGCLKK